MSPEQNKIIASRLREIGRLLEQQGANPFRVAAYRKAADSVEGLQQNIALILKTEGFEGLTSLAGIGRQIGGTIAEMIRTGESSQLERLRGAFSSEALFRRIPGIGPRLAARIVEELHTETLEALEIAAFDGRLDKLVGFGTRRLEMIRAALAQMLSRKRRGVDAGPEPSIGILLDVDREYRQKAEANQLRLIAPKRFNPTKEAWLPILHTERGAWTFTVLYSNTALAHSLGRTRDWVVIYFQHDSHRENQRTIVTETRGLLTGKRVVRGREQECSDHYRLLRTQPPNAA